jgi:hypothetical protein
MNAQPTGTVTRWAWSAGGALVVVATLVLLFSASHPPAVVSITPRPRPKIEIAERREKSALDDEATLLDPTPLFQPTRWNTARKNVIPPEPGGTFQSYRVPPKLGFADTELKLGRVEPADPQVKGSTALRTSLELPPPVTVPEKPADTLASMMPGALALGFGRTDRPVMMLPVYGAVVDIVAMGTGRPGLPPEAMAHVQALAAGAKPPKPPSGREWDALEFLAVVNAAGLASPLTITKRSGVEEVDSYFQNFLVKTLRVGERLTPGFYRISVGP